MCTLMEGRLERKSVNLRRKKNGLENLVLISQLGINVMTPVFLCLIAGDWLDRRFGTSLVVPLLIVGILAGGLSAYKMAKATIDKEKEAIEKVSYPFIKRMPLNSNTRIFNEIKYISIKLNDQIIKVIILDKTICHILKGKVNVK